VATSSRERLAFSLVVTLARRRRRALEVAEVMGYLAISDLAVPLALADRVLAMLFRLANPRR
jgi:hypothetical protein